MSFLWMFLALSLLCGTPAVTDAVGIGERGYIIVGDSRTVGMDSACDIASHANVFVVAKVGQGLRWLENDAIHQVESIKQAHTEIDDWTIVSNLGANDLRNCESYIDFYRRLDDDFIFVSVNPVKRGASISNENIDKFNARMRSEFDYIDSNTMLKLRGYQTPDGLHYTATTYKLIFSYLSHELGIV